MAKLERVVCDKCKHECADGYFIHFNYDTPPLAKAGQDICFHCILKVVQKFQPPTTRDTPAQCPSDRTDSPNITRTPGGGHIITHSSDCRCSECDAR